MSHKSHKQQTKRSTMVNLCHPARSFLRTAKGSRCRRWKVKESLHVGCDSLPSWGHRWGAAVRLETRNWMWEVSHMKRVESICGEFNCSQTSWIHIYTYTRIYEYSELYIHECIHIYIYIHKYKCVHDSADKTLQAAYNGLQIENT